MEQVKLFEHVKTIELPELDTTYRNGKRWYKIPGDKLYPSVTTVTGWEKREFFAEWRKNNPEESKISLSRGTEFHSVVEEYLNNKDSLNGQSTDCISLFEQFKPLLDDNINNIRAQEVPMYSNLLKLAGRVDCVADYNGKPSIIDFKTSKSEKKESWVQDYFAQATAYSIMWQEMTGESVDQIVILISSMDGTTQEFVKNPVKYVPRLKEMIDGYWNDNIPHDQTV